MSTITLATSHMWLEPKSDAPLREALQTRGHTVYSAPWNGPQEPFYDTDLVVIRACWDYHEAPDMFLTWLDDLERQTVRIQNTFDLVRWNFDKSYLIELGKAGFNVPDSIVVDPTDHQAILRHMEARGWAQAVRKPVSGQSGHYVDLLDVTTPESWALSAIPTTKALLQTYQPDISELGETLLVFFAGQFSHAVRRVLQPNEWRSNSQYGSYQESCDVEPTIIAQAENVLHYLPHTPLYARVDGLVRNDQFLLMELELIEPGLSFDLVPMAAHRFADAIESCLKLS